MEKKAISKFVRISAFKAREVTRLIQGKPVPEALAFLDHCPRKAATPVAKTQRYKRQPDNKLTLPAIPMISMIPMRRSSRDQGATSGPNVQGLKRCDRDPDRVDHRLPAGSRTS